MSDCKTIGDMTRDEVVTELATFGAKHALALQQAGEVGFGRPCVGFLRGDGYVNFNPHKQAPPPDYYAPVWPVDDRLCAPRGVDAYHKHDCMAVLTDEDEASRETGMRQLLQWVRHLESQGEVYVDTYATGATGIQALISGVFGHAVRLR